MINNLETIWSYIPPGEEAEAFSRKLGLPAPFTQILLNRGIDSEEVAEVFLHGGLDHLIDPLHMRGMETAVERIRRAVREGEPIIIFGDYDVDGILSVVALTRALKSIGGRVTHFIPERLKKGYGIKPEYLDVVLSRGAKLAISVDCGMRAVKFVEKAETAGVDVIITDHHQPGPQIPAALAVLNPVLESSGYPEKRLAGIGVVFKLIQELLTREGKESHIPHYLKLVAIATIADVAELRGENRILVRLGLKGLEQVSNPGLKSLLRVCGLSNGEIGVGDVGFRLGPRINAAGRLGETELAVSLFFTPSEEEANSIVSQLDKLNTKRQKIEGKIFQEALDLVQNKGLNEKYKLIIMGCKEWHRGVVGIVASKLKDALFRPVILFSYEDGRAVGSGRSIPGFSLIECLEHCHDQFLNYGGHTLAVGCELERANLAALKQAVNQYTRERLTDELLKKKIRIDARIRFEQIDQTFL
ncbi:MAG: single-stranded-DNA-specific exonuclease RecJ, partial [Candidatus Aminicenantes bacterium]|nr:single-stranded-DNA-specific exonuclease RecJ [Candidatus Aminicenantes bacterium]